jgi:hypothetical protein
MGIARIWYDPANPNTNRVYADPFFFPHAGMGPIPANYFQFTATDGSFDNSVTPPQTTVPVYSGGWPAYNNTNNQIPARNGWGNP